MVDHIWRLLNLSEGNNYQLRIFIYSYLNFLVAEIHLLVLSLFFT